MGSSTEIAREGSEGKLVGDERLSEAGWSPGVGAANVAFQHWTY